MNELKILKCYINADHFCNCPNSCSSSHKDNFQMVFAAFILYIVLQGLLEQMLFVHPRYLSGGHSSKPIK